MPHRRVIKHNASDEGNDVELDFASLMFQVYRAVRRPKFNEKLTISFEKTVLAISL